MTVVANPVTETPAPAGPAPVQSTSLPPVAPTNTVPAPALDTQTAIEFLRKQNHHVYAPDYQFNAQQQVDDPFIKGIVGKTTSNLYQGLDADIFHVTGIPKLTPDEKTYEYQRRTLAQLKEQIKTAPDVETVKKDYDAKLADKDKAIAVGRLESSVSGLKLNVPDVAKGDLQDLLVSRALTLPHRIDGPNVVFQKYADDGKTLIDVIDPTTGKPLAVGKFLETQFKNYLTVEEPAPQGTGQRPAPANTNVTIPKTIDEIGALVLAEGIGPGPAFQARVKVLMVQYAITQ